MDPVITKILEGTPYAGMGSTLERNALIGVIRNLINEGKYTVEYIISYCESVGYQRQMAEDIFKELTGLSPKLIINNNEYYNGPSYLPPYSIAWGYSKTKPNTVNLIVPFEYGYAVMEKDEVNAPIPTVISATIPEAFEELKKVAKGIQTLDKIITKKLLEAEDVQTDAHTVHQVNLPYAASPLQVLKKNFKDKVLSVSEFERQASKLLEADEITVDEAEDLMNWKQDLIDEDESYANEVLENNEKWNEVQATVDFDDVMNEVKSMANDDDDFLGFDNKAKELFDSNKDLFKNVDLIEAATRLYQLLLGFSKDEILGNSKFEKKQESKKAFQMTSEKGIRDFKAWSGAVDTQREIIDQGKADEFDALIEELYPQGIDETKLNDLLWFESDWIYETLGMTNPDEEDEEDNGEIDASLKKKATDTKIKEACYYIAEQASNDNNAEQGLEDVALEKAAKIFDIDEDILDDEWNKNNKYYFDTLFQYKNKKSASKKVTTENEFEKAFENDLIIDDENDNAWFPGYEEHKFKIEPSYEKMKEKALKIWKQIHSSKKVKSDMDLSNIPGVKFIWHGNWSDPEIQYDGYSFSYWEIEDALYKDYEDYHEESEDFNTYVKNNIKPLLDDYIASGYGEKIKASKKVKSKQLVVDVFDIDWSYKDLIDAKDHGIYLPKYHNKLIKESISEGTEIDDTEIEMEIREALRKEYEYEPDTFDYKIRNLNKEASLKKVTAENMTLDDIEEEDNKDQVQEEIEKIDEMPTEDIFAETTPEQYLDKALQEDKVDTINDVVSKCIDKFSEKFKDFDKYQVKILSYNTKVLEDDKPIEEEMVQDKELDANAILEVILQVINNAEEANIKKVLAVFSITNGELHWTGTVRGENDQVVAFTEEGLDALFEVNEPSEEELEDII